MAMLNAGGYTKIAGVLKRLYDDDEPHPDTDDTLLDEDTLDLVTVKLADLFERDSQNFDRQRFYNDAGMSIPMEEDQNGKRTG